MNVPTDHAPITTGQPAESLAPETSLLQLIGLAVATAAVGVAIRIKGGNYSPLALALIGLAAIALLPQMLRVTAGKAAGANRPIYTVVAVLVVVQLVLFRSLESPAPLPGSFEDIRRPAAAAMRVTATLAGSAALLLLSAFWAGRSRQIPGASLASSLSLGGGLLLHFVAMVVATDAVRHPVFDFYEIQRSAAWELLSGQNPYAMRIEGWWPGWDVHIHPSLLEAGRPTFGYIYMPLTLLQIVPAVLFGLDYRIAHALAASVTVMLVALMGRGSVPRLAAALLATTPFGAYVVAAGWTEPGVGIWLVMAVFFACRGGRTWSLGLFLASKQYVPLFAPLTYLLIPPESRSVRTICRWLLPGLLALVAITLPMVFWDVRAFFYSAVTVQLRQPFRPDSLSVLAWMQRLGVSEPSAILGFVALGFAQALALWRAPRSPAGFATAICLSLLLFFAFSKQAFANYYSLVVVAGACAMAAAGRDTTPAAEAAAESGAKTKPSRRKKSRR